MECSDWSCSRRVLTASSCELCNASECWRTSSCCLFIAASDADAASREELSAFLASSNCLLACASLAESSAFSDPAFLNDAAARWSLAINWVWTSFNLVWASVLSTAWALIVFSSAVASVFAASNCSSALRRSVSSVRVASSSSCCSCFCLAELCFWEARTLFTTDLSLAACCSSSDCIDDIFSWEVRTASTTDLSLAACLSSSDCIAAECSAWSCARRVWTASPSRVTASPPSLATLSWTSSACLHLEAKAVFSSRNFFVTATACLSLDVSSVFSTRILLKEAAACLSLFLVATNSFSTSLVLLPLSFPCVVVSESLEASFWFSIFTSFRAVASCCFCSLNLSKTRFNCSTLSAFCFFSAFNSASRDLINEAFPPEPCLWINCWFCFNVSLRVPWTSLYFAINFCIRRKKLSQLTTPSVKHPRANTTSSFSLALNCWNSEKKHR